MPSLFFRTLVMSISSFWRALPSDVRDNYSHLFIPPRPTLHQFLWQGDLDSVVRFVAACLDILLTAVTALHQP
jgi:hypothetical protein